MSLSAFYISQEGEWPNETYSIALCANIVNPNNGPFPAANYFRYLENPTNETTSLADFSYIDCSPFITDGGLAIIGTTNTTTFKWNISSDRIKNDIGYTVNSFYIDSTPSTNSAKFGLAPEGKVYYSYLFLPRRLLLEPTTKPTYSASGWSFNTTTKITKAKSFFYSTTGAPAVPSVNELYRYLQYPPERENYVVSSSTITYNLCASRTRVEVPIVSFTNNQNPYYTSTILEQAPYLLPSCKLRPYSTFVSFNNAYYFNDGTRINYLVLAQRRPDTVIQTQKSFTSSYILVQNTVDNIQTFQLVQLKQDNTNNFLSDARYCILSSVANLNNTNIKYYSNFYQTPNLTIVNNTTGIPNTFIGFSYIADCPTFALSNETWESTFMQLTNANLGVPTGATNVTWKTKYPPHYYGFKATVNHALSSRETADLTFSLCASTLSATYTNSGIVTSVTLHNYLGSNFNIIGYDYSDINMPSDFIKFNALTNTPTIFNSLCCYYGKNLNIPYNLASPTWIPASSAVNFLISYPVTTNGEISFVLRPSLSSLAGQLDAFTSTQITLAPTLLPYNPGQNIFITKTEEYADYMEVDSSFLNSVSSWPTRDLTNSYITWSASPLSPSLGMYSVDLSGNYIQPITQNTPILWGLNTASVVLSGYGPVATVITLSSQKYNETASLSTVPSLFDYFVENKVLVIPKVKLENRNYVRTIAFDVSVPYKGRVYDLPLNTLVNWTWTYDFNSLYTELPISAYDVFSEYYPFGQTSRAQTISTISVKLIPDYAETSPAIHNVSFIANIDTPKGLLQGRYDFQVDDFPSPKIFNADFYTYYTKYKDTPLASTRTDFEPVITRPNLPYNDYTLTPYKDISGAAYKTNLLWAVNSTFYPLVTALSGLELRYILSNPSVTTITLSSVEAIPPGWVSAHNTQSSVKFYIFDYQEFTKPLDIVVYPEYFWNNGRKATLANTSNYTLALAPTAYQNKKSNSQTFYLSSNKSMFDQYDYRFGSSYTNLTSVSSFLQLVDIPYYSDLSSFSGLQISLSAFNNTSYPKRNGIYYIAPVDNELMELPFYITSKTIPFNTSLINSKTFYRSPRTIPYGNPTFTFTTVNSSLTLDKQTTISITQTISTSTFESPVQPIGGTVVYTLSTEYWTAKTTVPAVNGTFDLFNLSVGDAALPLTVSKIVNNVLTIGASAQIITQIPASTFVDYPNYPNKDLWNPVNNYIITPTRTIYANLTGVIPQVFISTVYTLTGNNIFVEFETPYILDNYNIAAYIVDFGEDFEESTKVCAFDEVLKYQYSTPGTYYINYSAVFTDNTIAVFQNSVPIIVSNTWNTYDPNTLRKVENAKLTIPYTQTEIEIQPNEFGDADIFNTSITRIQECIDYLSNNLKTLNTNSPTVYFGWLGSNTLELADGIKWHTESFYPNYYPFPNFAVSQGTSYFSNLRDVKETKNHIFVLDGKNLRAFSAGKIPIEIDLVGLSDLGNTLINPISIEVDNNETMMFICDPPNNRVFRYEIDLYKTLPDINPSLTCGGLGSKDDTNKFNSPSEIVYINNIIYVLDYNNRCVKEFNSDLAWRFTYYIDTFNTDRPVNIAVHPHFNYVYILCESNTVYIFEERSNEFLSSFTLNQIVSPIDINKIIFDENGDFIYIVTSSTIYKYSVDGYYITNLNLPTDITFNGGKQTSNRSLLFFGNTYIIKVQDILETYTVGDGLPTTYWSKDQLMVSRDEFSSDLNYNRSFIRLAQNMKTFRNSLNAKLVLATEQTSTNVVTYFAIAPISRNELPTFNKNIELENVGVGVNELHVPQTINKELVKFYDAVSSLTTFLDITNYNVNDGNNSTCTSDFCWSWKAMSCYNLTLPLVRICSINPITYAELEANFPVSYAPTKKWGEAVSSCCEKVIPPV